MDYGVCLGGLAWFVQRQTKNPPEAELQLNKGTKGCQFEKVSSMQVDGKFNAVRVLVRLHTSKTASF
jgi:hypothetical protein